MKVEWILGLPIVQGKNGCPHNVGGLDMHKSAVFDPKSGCLIQGPVLILKLDAGPGRIVSSAGTLAKREVFLRRV